LSMMISTCLLTEQIFSTINNVAAEIYYNQSC
jgi:hypothetical protein